MLLSEIISYVINRTESTYTECAANLGISKQNFGQRLRRDTFDLEEAQEIVRSCGAELEIVVRIGDDTFRA